MKNKYLINEEWDKIFNKNKENNFSNHAFSLFLFIKRLYEKLEELKCKDILFMSREGQFLKKLFDEYLKIRKENRLEVININSHYFYGSRNSIIKASVEDLSKENFEVLFKFFNFFMTPNSFMHSIGFSDEQIFEVEKTFGKQINKKRSTNI